MTDHPNGRGVLRPLDTRDLPMVLVWRNHISVRECMYTTHEVNQQEHLEWHQKSQLDPNRHLYIFEKENIPLGFVNILQISSNGLADWGFYLAPDAPKGCGKSLGIAALEHCFNVLHLRKICGQVLEFNIKSIAFHRALGFQHEGTLRAQHFDGTRYYDIIHFGLLNTEWQSHTMREKS